MIPYYKDLRKKGALLVNISRFKVFESISLLSKYNAECGHLVMDGSGGTPQFWGTVDFRSLAKHLDPQQRLDMRGFPA